MIPDVAVRKIHNIPRSDKGIGAHKRTDLLVHIELSEDFRCIKQVLILVNSITQLS